MGQPTFSRIVHTLRKSARPKADPADSDHDLLTRFLTDRDEDAFRALVGRHGATVLVACRQVLSDPADIDDAFQATFLVLLKKAKRVDASTPLGGWLFAVAHRVAVRCRSDARRRRSREAAAASRSRKTIELPDLSWREAAAVLHDELNALPDKYRLPLLLCSVQGLTRDEAAEQLGTTVGAVRGQLERGRSLLERRLTRRGVVLSAGLLAVMVGGSRAAGGPSAELIDLTLRAAGGTVDPAVAVLAHGAFPMAATLKHSILSAVLVLGLLGAGLAIPLEQPPAATAGQKPPAKADPKAAAPKAAAERAVTGRVLGTDGKPVVAELILLRPNGPAVSLGKAAADGTFTVTVPAGDDAYLVAHADGHGADFRGTSRNTSAEVTFKLPKDHPVRGRVVDTQGKPVAGAVVSPRRIDDYGAKGADVFLNDWKTRNPQGGRLSGENDLALTPRTGLTLADGRTVLAAATDADGRFELRGLGAERVVNLLARGPGIADTEVLVVNRAGFDPAAANQAAADNRERMVPKQIRSGTLVPQLHGPAVTLVAEHEKVIRGVVKDRDTGRPRAGVEVTFGRVSNMSLLPHSHTATTDKDGRFEIRGSRKHPSYIPEVPADPAAGYLPAQAEATDTAGYEPIDVEILTAKGVVLTGKLTDGETGKPLPGIVWVEPMQENPYLKKYPTMNRSRSGPQLVVIGDDGMYRIVTIPGPVLVMAGLRVTQHEVMYKPPQADPKYPQYFREDWGHLMYATSRGGYTTLRGCWCKVLDVPEGEKAATLNVELEREKRKAVRVVDQDGNPVPECNAAGIVPRDTYPILQDSGTVSVYGLKPDEGRLVVVCEQRRKLVGSLVVKESDKDPVVTLAPGGTVKGRAVGPDGKPLAGVAVHLHHLAREAEGVFGLLHFAAQPAVTDETGAFRIDAVVPGHEFRLTFSKGSKNLGPNPDQAPRHKVDKPGETKDVGDVTVRVD